MTIGFNMAMWILLVGLLFNGLFFFAAFVTSCFEDRKIHWAYLLSTGFSFFVVGYIFY